MPSSASSSSSSTSTSRPEFAQRLQPGGELGGGQHVGGLVHQVAGEEHALGHAPRSGAGRRGRRLGIVTMSVDLAAAPRPRAGLAGGEVVAAQRQAEGQIRRARSMFPASTVSALPPARLRRCAARPCAPRRRSRLRSSFTTLHRLGGQPAGIGKAHRLAGLPSSQAKARRRRGVERAAGQPVQPPRAAASSLPSSTTQDRDPAGRPRASASRSVAAKLDAARCGHRRLSRSCGRRARP